MTDTSTQQDVDEQDVDERDDDEAAARAAGWTEADEAETEDGSEDSADSDSDEDSDKQGTGAESPTADRIPEPGADIEEGEVTGDASELDTDVENRIDEADPTGDPSDEEAEEIEEERKERLDPDNRPNNAEVDNSARDFDIASGQFTDHDTDDAIGPFNDPTAPDGEIEA